jgi:hypothetical protein
MDEGRRYTLRHWYFTPGFGDKDSKMVMGLGNSQSRE